MNKVLLLWGTITFVFGQNIFKNETQIDPFKFGFNSAYISEQFNTTSYVGSTFFFNYDWSNWTINSEYNANQYLSLSLENPIYTIPDSIPSSVISGLEIRPNTYQLHYPLQVSAKFKYFKWSFGVSSNLVYEFFEKENVIGVLDENNQTSIKYATQTAEKYSLDTQFYLNTTSGKNTFGIGFKNISIPIIDDGLDHKYTPKSYPFLTYEYNLETSLFLSKYESGVTYLLNLSNDIDLTSSLQMYPQLDERFHIETQFLYKMNQALDVYVNFELNLGTFSDIKIGDLNRFLNNVRPDKYNHKTLVAIGAQYSFTDGRELVKPIIESFLLSEQNIFTYDPDQYSDNPFATVKLLNNSENTLFYRILVTSEQDYIFYESELLRHRPNEKLIIPLYAYFNKQPGVNDRIDEKIYIKLYIDGFKENIYQDYVKLNGRSFWDGNVNGLKVYINHNDTYMNRRLMNEFHSIADKQIDLIKEISETFGKKLNYKEDPIISNEIDEVQSPFITHTSKTGDCEDFVVYFSYVFSNQGIENEIFSIKSKEGHQAHVLLLLNTGLIPEEAEKHGLNEFNSIVRTDRFGAFKVWIPFETTVVSEGFEAALKEGSHQYYSIIQNNSPDAYDIIQVKSR